MTTEITQKRVATPASLLNMIRMLPLDTQCHVLFSNPLGDHIVVCLPINGDTNNPEFMVLDTDEKKKKALDFICTHIEKQSKNLSQFFWAINKPDRLNLLYLFSGIYTFNGEYEKILKDAWTSTEFPHQMKIRDLVHLFERSDKKQLMDEQERAFLDALPDEITVYRGLQDKRAKLKGLSWTLNYEKAEWFARRWNSKDGKVVTATIQKKFVYMYTNQRAEEEIVLNPYRLKHVRDVQGEL